MEDHTTTKKKCLLWNRISLLNTSKKQFKKNPPERDRLFLSKTKGKSLCKVPIKTNPFTVNMVTKWRSQLWKGGSPIFRKSLKKTKEGAHKIEHKIRTTKNPCIKRYFNLSCLWRQKRNNHESTSNNSTIATNLVEPRKNGNTAINQNTNSESNQLQN